MASGVGVRTLTTIWSITTAVAVVVGLPWGLLALPVGLAVQQGLAWLFRSDPEIFELYAIHEVIPNTMMSGQPPAGIKSSRPEGYARQHPM